MNEMITSARPLAEFLYFITSILLLGGLGLAYRQLTLIKRDIQLRNHRAAAEKAIEACDRYLCEYILQSKPNYEERIESKLFWYKGSIGDFSESSIPANLKDECAKRFKLKSWLPALNRLEAIAAYFTAGVADESVGFRVIGRTFCSAVESNYDIIAFSRSEKPNAYWENIVELYSLWRPRLTKAELELAKQDMDDKISCLPQKAVVPIGVAG